MKRFISLMLAVVMIISAGMVSAYASKGSKTTCGGEGVCDKVPTIVIHGIGQSNVWLTDGNGNYVLDKDGNRISCFPCYADVGKIVKRALVPVLLTLVTQHDAGLSKALSKIVEDIFYMNISDDNGKESKYVELESYNYSLAECSTYERNEIYSNVPIWQYGLEVGEDHLYYFAYNSLGNMQDIVDDLYKFIEQVKEETGHDKVNLIPISMGGAVSNGLLEWYNGTYENKPDVYNSIHKVVYIVPALDGASIIGDIYTKNLTFLDMAYLYDGFLEELMDEGTARWIEVALRILPDDVINQVLDNTVDALIKKVFARNTNLWALCPSADYQKGAELWLSDPSMKNIKEQTDAFHIAQLNSKKNIQRMKDMGIQVFDIVDYDFPIYNVGKSWNIENGDGIIDLDSTSIGAVSATVGNTLPAGYKQANTSCKNADHNHISPDRVVDASTGLLPDTTFYFDGQSHEATASNDIIMALATALLVNDDIKDVYSSPDFPQFNVGRNTRKVRNSYLPLAYDVDQSAITKEQAERLNKAIANAEAMLLSTVGKEGEAEAVELELYEALVDVGVITRNNDKPVNPGVPSKISKWLLSHYETNGFSEYPIYSIKKAFSLLFKK